MMLDSIYYLPEQWERFWSANIGIKIQVLLFLAGLYLLGLYSVRLLLSGVWWKWLIFLILLVPVVVPLLKSYNIVFVGPIAIGAIREFFKDSRGFNPFEWVTDAFYWLRSRREASTSRQQAEALRQESEERLRRSQEYEAKAKASFEQQEAERKAFEKRMREEEQRRRANWSKSERQKSEEAPKQGSAHKLDPSVLADAYEILGVAYGASLTECKRARMTLLAMYHPDKVAHLNETRRKMAEEEAKRINAAWERVKY